MNQQQPGPRMAIDCRWLKRSLDPARRDPYAKCCTHIVRDGADCVGPFLEDMETPCGLWDLGAVPTRRRGPALGRGHS
ncbi:MAG: hypothetical protein WCQ48_05450 [Chloroflexota bacterium]